MKIKSSNRKPNFLILALLISVVVLLLSFKAMTTHTPKYVKAPKFDQETTLDFIQITLKEKHFKKLKEKRNKAISVGILETSDEDYVPATIAYNNKDYKAEVRLKGDWTDHLIDNKWSFRVKLKGDETILGMRKFSLHTPKARNYINEWLYQKTIKNEDLFGLRYGFLEGAIHVKLENSSKYESMNVGVYAIEETFDKRTIESNRRKESIILKFSEDFFWQEVKKATHVGYETGQGWDKFTNDKLDFKNSLPISVFSESKVLSDPTMNDYFKLSKNLLQDVRQGRKDLAQVFDVKELAMQNAILNLFGAVHGSYIINLRFYYNPITSKLEPIAFDGGAGIKLKKYEHFLFVDQKRDSAYFKELAFALSKVSEQKYIDNLLDEYQADIDYYSKHIKKEFKVKGISIENMRYNQSILKQELFRLKDKYNLAIESPPTSISETGKTELTDILIPKASLWINNGITLKDTQKAYNNASVYSMERKTSPSYTIIPNLNINSQSEYEFSIVVKKNSIGNSFGIRMQGIYPDRADAIFNLEKGELIDVSHSGVFEGSEAKIQPLGEGWYKCFLTTKPKTSSIKLIFGPTTDEKKSINWEGLVTLESNVYLIPESLSLEQLAK